MTIALNVVLESTEEVRAAVIGLSTRIAGAHDACFALDGHVYHPHVTLYKAVIDERRVPAVLAAAVKVARGNDSFCCTFRETSSGRGYIFVRLGCPPALRRLHEAVVREVNPLRVKGIRVRSKRAMTPEEEQNNRQYGHPNVLNTYSPHMTITRLNDAAEADRIAKEISWTLHTFPAVSIGVYRTGVHGTCRELLHTAAFQ